MTNPLPFPCSNDSFYWLLLGFFSQNFVVYCVWPSNADDVSQAFIYKDLEGIDGGGSFSPSFGTIYKNRFDVSVENTDFGGCP